MVNSNIRPPMPPEHPALLAVAQAIGFQSEELALLNSLLDGYWANPEQGDRIWLVDDDPQDGLVGVAYCELERMTDRTWNLLLIAVRSDRQGGGRGSALLRYVEAWLVARGGRLLLAETSGQPEFAGARSFYQRCGYQAAGEIQDFYADGDSKIIFRKLLQPA
jgi:GNAT superfamily N-acetyltransferase